MTYLDHAGATLYAKSQLEAHVAGLTTNLYGNPHSQTPSSLLSTAAVDHARDSVLRFFGTDSSRYDVVFTSSCTSALKLLCESFPWHCGRKGYPQVSSGATSAHVNEFSKVAQFLAVRTPLFEAGENSLLNHSSTTSENRPAKTRDTLFDSSDLERTGTTVLYTRDLRDSDNSCVPCENGGSVFCYLEDNHTSVVGMREVAAQFGASVVCTTEQDIISSPRLEFGATLLVSGASQITPVTVHSEDRRFDHSEIFNLFAYPAQSNFSGRKYPLSWSTDIPNGRLLIAGVHPPAFREYPRGTWKVCLDAAAFVGTNPLDLTENPVDFVTLSFYKMFGFPTGLGALIVRKDNSQLLHKSYYGGGTVVSTVSRANLHVSRPDLHER